jgi:hypothetical protein
MSSQAEAEEKNIVIGTMSWAGLVRICGITKSAFLSQQTSLKGHPHETQLFLH